MVDGRVVFSDVVRGDLYSFVRDISHSEKNSVRRCYRYTRVFTCSTRCSRGILTKLEFSRIGK
jgi:hypothetical protein